MKKRIITICSIIVVLILLVTAILLGVLLPKKNDGSGTGGGNEGGGPTPPVVTPYSVKQTLNYNESIAKIDNPDQGFYYPVLIRLGAEGVLGSNTNAALTEHETDYKLFHLRFDISALSGAINGNEDLEFSQAAMNALRNELNTYKNKQKNVIVRFAYDPYYRGEHSNPEPQFNMLLSHVEKISSVLNDFEDCITAVEAGMIGKWGEMTSGTNYLGSTYYTPLLETFLSNTQNIKILARTPQMIYDYLRVSNKDVLQNNTITLNAKTKRLGFYNDSFLNNWNDLGTYLNIDSIDDVEGTNANTCRYVHEAFLGQFTANTGFGGETVKNSNPLGDLHIIDKCLPEMKTLHLSYLNGTYDSNTLNVWKEQIYDNTCVHDQPCDCALDELYYGQTGYTYIENHMGYRLVLKDSVFDYTSKYDELTVKLNLENVGFGNFNKTKNLKLMFVNESGTVVYQNAVGTYNGESNITLTTSMNLQNGNYKVYLCVYSGELNSPSYCVQFANNGAESWNTTLNANLVGQITINK